MTVLRSRQDENHRGIFPTCRALKLERRGEPDDVQLLALAWVCGLTRSRSRLGQIASADIRIPRTEVRITSGSWSADESPAIAWLMTSDVLVMPGMVTRPADLRNMDIIFQLPEKVLPDQMLEMIKNPFWQSVHLIQTMKYQLQYLGVSLLSVAGVLVACPAQAQNITGAPGSASATVTIDGKQIPPAPLKFGGVIKESVRLQDRSGRRASCRPRGA